MSNDHTHCHSLDHTHYHSIFLTISILLTTPIQVYWDVKNVVRCLKSSGHEVVLTLRVSTTRLGSNSTDGGGSQEVLCGQYSPPVVPAYKQKSGQYSKKCFQLATTFFLTIFLLKYRLVYMFYVCIVMQNALLTITLVVYFGWLFWALQL